MIYIITNLKISQKIKQFFLQNLYFFIIQCFVCNYALHIIQFYAIVKTKEKT